MVAQNIYCRILFMDKEILYIYEVLSSSKAPLTSPEISKEIFNRHEFKLSRTIVRNYLWSYFRDLVEYDAAKYTFVLKDDQFLISDIDVSEVKNPPRAVCAQFEGARINVSYDDKIPISVYIKAIALLNFKHKSSVNKVDLVKQLNRTIEQILVDHD